MKRTFVISWRSATSERSGRGKKLMSWEEAEALASELNFEYPAFIHEVVDTEAIASAPVEAAAA